MLKYLFKIIVLLFIGVTTQAQTLQPTNLPTTNAPSRWDDIYGIRGIITMYHETDTFPSKFPAMIKHLNHKYYTTNGNGAPWTELGGSGKAYYTINPAPDSSYVTIKSLDGTQVDTIKFLDQNAGTLGDKNLTMNNSGAGAPSGTVFDRMVDLVLSYNTIGASPLAGSSSLTTVGNLISGGVPYTLLTGTVPTWNQNTTGTAANITATSNSTLVTLSSLSLPYSQLTGVPTASANLTLNNTGGGDVSPIIYNGSTPRTISYNTIGAQPLENQRLSTGNNVSFANVTATALIKSGATGVQILAGDGSVITAGTNITISGGVISAAGGGGTSAALTMNSSGSGATSGTTFNGSVAQTISYNTIGAYAASNPSGFITNSVTTLGSLSLPYSQLTGTPTIPTALPTPNAVTFNNSGSGGSSGITFNGSTAQTISYNTIGAYAASNPSGFITNSVVTLGSLSLPYSQLTGVPTIPTALPTPNALSVGSSLAFASGSSFDGSAARTIDAIQDIRTTANPTWAIINGNSFVKSGHTGTNVLVDDGTSLAFSVATSSAPSTLAERDASGNLNAVGFFETSDISLKNVIGVTGDMLLFEWKPELMMDKKLHYGYSAQEVQKLYPDMVKTGDDGKLSVDYIQVLVKKVNDLEQEVKYLKENR